MKQNLVSTKTLIKSSIAAMVMAALVLVTIILPAEYNIDPTNIGKALGLTVLSQTNTAASPTNAAGINQSQDVIEVSVPAGKGIEYKFYMKQYEKMNYEWITDGESLYFDLHGEPEGDTTGYFESYAIATLKDMKGTFKAPFAATHGWYWKNSSDKPVAVQLIVEGQYEVIGLK
jgi:hypothetical protein